MAGERVENVSANASANASVNANHGWASQWYLRVPAWCAVLAAILGVVIGPGLRGNASEDAVNVWDGLASEFAYGTFGMLVLAVVLAAADLTRVRIERAWRSIAISCAILIVGVASWATRARLLPQHAVVLAIATAGIASVGSLCGVRGPHTRAMAFVLGAFGLSALVRVAAWEVAYFAGERAIPALYGLSRGFATVSVMIEGLGQLTAAAWLGTRGRISGLALPTIAVLVAFAVTWSAAHGGHIGAPLLESVLHTALADAACAPPPFGLNAAATFLSAAGILLALASLLARGQPPGIVSALALALIARGAFDVPLRALSMALAAMWTVLAMLDDRALWSSLTKGPTHKKNEAPASAPAENVAAKEVGPAP